MCTLEFEERERQTCALVRTAKMCEALRESDVSRKTSRDGAWKLDSGGEWRWGIVRLTDKATSAANGRQRRKSNRVRASQSQLQVYCPS